MAEQLASRTRRAGAVALVAAMLAACAPGASQHTNQASPSVSASRPTESAEVSAAPSAYALLEGDFDVGGYSLHLKCEGSGSPTVVYLHGLSWAEDAGQANSGSARALPSLLRGHTRYCGYDRANVGRSDIVPGPLSGASSARDLHALLGAAGIEPPYVLLGASFGGLVADIYAATYPDDVVGMVLLDAGFPDELDLEHFFPEEERLKHEEHGFSGWGDNHERMDELAAYEDAFALIGSEPAIPVTYLLATPLTAEGPADYLAAFPAALRAHVDRFSPGEIREIQSAHYMEAAIPQVVADEVAAILALVEGSQ